MPTHGGDGGATRASLVASRAFVSVISDVGCGRRAHSLGVATCSVPPVPRRRRAECDRGGIGRIRCGVTPARASTLPTLPGDGSRRRYRLNLHPWPHDPGRAGSRQMRRGGRSESAAGPESRCRSWARVSSDRRPRPRPVHHDLGCSFEPRRCICRARPSGCYAMPQTLPDGRDKLSDRENLRGTSLNRVVTASFGGASAPRIEALRKGPATRGG